MYEEEYPFILTTNIEIGSEELRKGDKVRFIKEQEDGSYLVRGYTDDVEYEYNYAKKKRVLVDVQKEVIFSISPEYLREMTKYEKQKELKNIIEDFNM